MLQDGQDFAHFKITRKIGAGGMGEVYLAQDKKLNRKVALKVLRSESFEDNERLERFRREARTAAQISHSNVMAIYDIGTAKDESGQKDIQYIVMEYIDGEELSSYIQRNATDLAGKVRLGEKIASGLAAAHKLNIVHRDIKADNILIATGGEPKILDFGLAKPLEPIFDTDENTATVSGELTRAGKIMGTVSYMSPEQARGDAVDVRSDIFSYGILLYQMVTGSVPFSGPTHMSTLAKILETKHEAPTTKNANIPPELERIIDKCLQKDANDRYQDTRDLVVDLRNLRRQYDSGVTDTITGQTARYTAQKQSDSKRKKIIGWVGAVGVILIGWVVLNYGTLTITDNSNVVAAENTLAIVGFENKTGDTTLNWLETGLPEILLTDLAQSKSLKLISRERILDCFPNRKEAHSVEECIKAAKSLGAARILSGSYYRLGDNIRIDARLEDVATGKIVMAEKVMGIDPFPLIDSITNKISAALELNNDSGYVATSVTRFTSSSPEAFKLYLDGTRLFSKELYEEAIETFKKAIAIDDQFAMPYLRIGMSYVFMGRQGQGRQYLQMAKERESGLPIRERTMLDMYIDVWLEQDYDNAFNKMKTFVRNYPDDKEVRTLYAILLNVFTSDSTVAIAQLDTVLSADPNYQFALSQYTSIERGWGNDERAIEMAQRLVNAHSDSPDGFYLLGSLYRKAGRTEDAIRIYEKMIEDFSSNPQVIKGANTNLLTVSIQVRDFDRASEITTKQRELIEDDPLELSSLYGQLGNLALWHGELKENLNLRRKSLREVLKSDDSASITNIYIRMATYFYRYEMDDSAKYYLNESRAYAPALMRLNYPALFIMWFPEEGKSLLPLFEKEIENVKARLPEELWGEISKLGNIINAFIIGDSLAAIEGYRELVKDKKSQARDNRRDLGELLVLTGSYQEGAEKLEELLTDASEQVGAYNYITDNYYLGIAYEKLGDNEKAIARYREVLKYWGNADIDIKPIRESREGLARLTS